MHRTHRIRIEHCSIFVDDEREELVRTELDTKQHIDLIEAEDINLGFGLVIPPQWTPSRQWEALLEIYVNDNNVLYLFLQGKTTEGRAVCKQLNPRDDDEIRGSYAELNGVGVYAAEM